MASADGPGHLLSLKVMRVSVRGHPHRNGTVI